MRIFIRTFAFILWTYVALAQNDAEEEPRQIAQMRIALDQGGISELLDQVNLHSWKVPQIPSRWHVEHVSRTEQKSADIAAREFGEKLTQRLNAEAPNLQQLPATDALYQEVSRLFTLSEWCASTNGYGNFLLAQRSLDLAAVGLARMTANLDFPLERITDLLARLNPSWMNIEANQRVLNLDAGATIFPIPNREEMERTYGSGRRLLEEHRDPALFAERQKSPGQWKLVETPAVKANLSFFEGVELAEVESATLSNLWNYNWHLRIINGLELQSVQKAKALLEFRRAIGKFPERPVFTDEQLRERERGSAGAAKAGLKVSNMEDAYTSPQAAAFVLAWRNYLEKQGEDLGKIPSWKIGVGSVAYQAYDEVQHGTFLDQDTVNSRK